MNFKSIFFTTIVYIAAIFSSTAKPANPKDIPSRVTVYSEDGEKFVLYANGIKQNTTPLAKVEVNDLKGAIVKLNAVFANPALPPVAKNVMRMAKDCEYSISKNKKGEYIINMKTAGTLGTTEEEQKAISKDSPATEPAPSKNKPVKKDNK